MRRGSERVFGWMQRVGLPYPAVEGPFPYAQRRSIMALFVFKKDQVPADGYQRKGKRVTDEYDNGPFQGKELNAIYFCLLVCYEYF